MTPTGSELSGLRLARISWVIGLALTAVFLSYKVVQLLLTPAVIDGASGITGPEMLVALVSLFSVVPIAAGIVLAHVAISRGALADLRARTHALFGLVALLLSRVPDPQCRFRSARQRCGTRDGS